MKKNTFYREDCYCFNVNETHEDECKYSDVFVPVFDDENERVENEIKKHARNIKEHTSETIQTVKNTGFIGLGQALFIVVSIVVLMQGNPVQAVFLFGLALASGIDYERYGY